MTCRNSTKEANLNSFGRTDAQASTDGRLDWGWLDIGDSWRSIEEPTVDGWSRNIRRCPERLELKLYTTGKVMIYSNHDLHRDKMKLKQSHAVSLLYHVIPIIPLSLAVVGLEFEPIVISKSETTNRGLVSPTSHSLHTTVSLPIISIWVALHLQRVASILPPTHWFAVLFSIAPFRFLVPGSFLVRCGYPCVAFYVCRISQRFSLLQGKQYYCFQDTVIRYLLPVGPCSTCVMSYICSLLFPRSRVTPYGRKHPLSLPVCSRLISSA